VSRASSGLRYTVSEDFGISTLESVPKGKRTKNEKLLSTNQRQEAIWETMNVTLKVIKSRRSVRKYKPDQISDSELQAILEAAIRAPNAMNQQRWHFTVIQNKDVLEKLTDVARKSMKPGPEPIAKRAASPDFSPFYHAPTVILITGDSTSQFTRIDCSLAAQNIVLAAESLNIGSCIMTSPELIFKSEKGRELLKELGVPEGYAHVCTVTLGYKDGASPPAKPRNKEVFTYVK